MPPPGQLLGVWLCALLVPGQHELHSRALAGDAAALDAALEGTQSLQGRRLPAVDEPVLQSLSILLSTGHLAPIVWKFATLRYSLTVPQEAVAAAVVATVNAAYSVTMVLLRPEDGKREVLTSGVPSAYADVPTEEAANLILEVRHAIRATNYTILVMRSTITSNFEFKYPDPASTAPPQGTLTGLVASDTFGTTLRMEPAFFDPRKSQYWVTAEPNSGGGYSWTRIIASKNDPEATLQMRIDGSTWQDIESGIASPHIAIPTSNWLLLEVKVSSPSALIEGFPALVYQLLVSREVKCHDRCRTCYGPEDSQCLTCRAPLVMFNGSCLLTACPPDTYYEWGSYQCRKCHPSCAQCAGPGRLACTLCPALQFLSPETWEARQGPCVLLCPTDMFAHPPSRRCRKPPANPVKTFYMRFKFRTVWDEFTRDPTAQESVLNASAFVLGLALSDVRGYKLDTTLDRDGYSLPNGPPMLTIEVVSPFIAKDEADQVTIDTWFGAFDIPVDEVRSFTWDDLHPPLPPLPVEPFLPTWGWGMIISGASGVFLILPVYCCYFRRLANTRGKYQAQIIDPSFIDKIVNQSDSTLVRRFIAREDGAKMVQDTD